MTHAQTYILSYYRWFDHGSLWFSGASVCACNIAWVVEQRGGWRMRWINYTWNKRGKKMILGKFYDQITWMAPGVWFLLIIRKEGKNSSGPKTIASHVRLIRQNRRTRFAGPIERYFSHGEMRWWRSTERSVCIYIYKTAKDKSNRLYQWHIPLVLITDTDRLNIQSHIYYI